MRSIHKLLPHVGYQCGNFPDGVLININFVLFRKNYFIDGIQVNLPLWIENVHLIKGFLSILSISRYCETSGSPA